jgi:nicotinate phosphoribosyltransferase
MQHEPIITSLLDTDLYKLTMLQTTLHRFPQTHAEYEFKCRNVPGMPLKQIYESLNEQLDALCSLHFTEEELAYIRGLRFMKTDFVDFLENFQLKRRYIQVECDPKADPKDQLKIRAAGPMVQSMMFEIYQLSLINELVFRELARGREEEVLAEGRRRLQAKIEVLRASEAARAGIDTPFPFVFFEFGTRRRFSKAWQEEVLRTLLAELPDYLKGSSNIDLARRLGLTPIGTMAHEYLQAHQALGCRLRDFQKVALENWVAEYRGDLGIALTDVVGMDAFLRDFDLYFAKLFDGLRHDSGDPIEWGEKALAHYAQLKIDGRTKQLVFSDGLSMEQALALYRHFVGRTKTGFGIGTSLTNDMGLEPLQIVAKMVRCNGQPVAKVPDTPGKSMCTDANFLNYLADVFQLKAL